ncbi:MAG TPA: hypothetical protein VG318_17500 [Actinomycetota bacterium]|nr:hypothetical protein [Actinomycetota bacterium]
MLAALAGASGAGPVGPTIEGANLLLFLLVLGAVVWGIVRFKR